MSESAPSPAPLVLSGGGSTRVATDAVLAEAALLRRMHEQASGWQDRLEGIRRLDSSLASNGATLAVGLNLGAAGSVLHVLENRCGDLADRLTSAAEAYGWAERTAEHGARSAAALGAYVLGRMAPFALLSAAPAILAGLLAWLGLSGVHLLGGPAAPALAARVIREHPELLTNPQVVAAVRLLVSSLDDVAAGALGAPWPLSFALGGLGVLGVTTSAAGVRALAGPVGLLRESPVVVRRAGVPESVPPPTGLDELAARIPRAAEGNPQVRIERYGAAEQPAWAVYVGGTVEWGPGANQEPWDLTSNVAAIAEQNPGSYRAVVQAMREAGIAPGDPVVQAGHSQGGVIAAQVAASGQFNTVLVATFGSPSAQVPVPAGTSTLAVEHADDLVPALAGTAVVAAADRLIVSREVFSGRTPPPGEALPAHHLKAYRDTARLIDASAEPRLQGFRAELTATLGSATGTASRWRSTRVAPIVSPAG